MLTDQRRQVCLTMDGVGEAVWVANTDGVLLFVSRRLAAMLGRDPRMMIGQSVLSHVDRASHAQVRQLLAEPTLYTGRWQYVNLCAADDLAITCTWSTYVIKDGQGVARQIVGVVGSTKANVAVKQLEMRKQTERPGRSDEQNCCEAGDHAMRHMVHELSQPVSAIGSFVGAALRKLERGNLDNESLRNLLNDIAAQAKRAGDYIVHYRRQSVQCSSVNAVHCHVNGLVSEAVRAVRPATDCHRIDVVLDLTDGGDELMICPTQIEQVLINLAQNAIDAMVHSPHPRRMKIRTQWRTEDLFEASVSDTGVGLSDVTRRRMFDPTYTTKSTGMGVGLTICHAIIESHGGCIGARRNDGPGATVWFDLPVT